MIKLVVALGNPGNEYAHTRHNVAWMVIDEFERKHTLNWLNKFKGEYCKVRLGSEDVFFLKPMTYMNLSGESVRKLTDFFKIEVEDILIIHDEIDLDFGVIAFKTGGGLAGNNGLKSIKLQMGSADFKRLRVGVSKPAHGDVSGHVLGKFSKEEQIDLPKVLEACSEALTLCLKENFSKAASAYSKKKIIERL